MVGIQGIVYQIPAPKELVSLAEYASGALAFEAMVATHAINEYTTTLHAINSAIVKLGKLTHAAKVYRGVSAAVLPEWLWSAASPM